MPKLFLIPNYISSGGLELQLPTGIANLIGSIDVYIVENIRNARRFIRLLDKEKNIDGIKFLELNKHTDPNSINSFLEDIGNGKDIGLLSEAGVPCVADPGAVIVKMAHERNIEVVPVTGPSSILLALMASGLNGQGFCFHGYLPIKNNDRIKTIGRLEKRVKDSGETQIFIETPYRNNQLMKDITNNCYIRTKLCVGVEIYGQNGFIKTKTMGEWKTKLPDLHKKTVVFLLGR